MSSWKRSSQRRRAVLALYLLGQDGPGRHVGSGQNLRVYGIDRLRIADGSIMPNVTTGNTMAPCVIIGEHAAEIIRKDRAI